MSSPTQPIDWQHCLSITNQKADLAHEILTMFMSELPDYKQKIQDHYAAQDYEELHQVVHKLHGATCYCGTTRLKSLLSQFETALKAHRIDSYEAMYADVVKEMKAVEEYYQSNEFTEVAT